MDISRYAIQDALIDLCDKLDVGMEYDQLNALTETVQAAFEAAAPKSQEFLVSLEIGIYASTPEAAVREFIEMIERTRKGWVYKTTDENNEETVVDSYNW